MYTYIHIHNDHAHNDNNTNANDDANADMCTTCYAMLSYAMLGHCGYCRISGCSMASAHSTRRELRQKQGILAATANASRTGPLLIKCGPPQTFSGPN